MPVAIHKRSCVSLPGEPPNWPVWCDKTGVLIVFTPEDPYLRVVMKDGGNEIRTYTSEEILEYKKSPLSSLRPKIDDPRLSCWRREAVEEEMKKSGSDPKERTRRENEKIVLSPQRGGNFKLGCVMPAFLPSQPAQLNPQQPQRRIGSGRLLSREWDGSEEKNDVDDLFPGSGRRKKLNSFSSDVEGRGRSDRPMSGRANGLAGLFRTDNNQLRPDGRQMRPMKPSNGLFNEIGMQGPKQRMSDDRRNNRNNGHPSESIPEWFTEGPISQHDRIDLHGFEDPNASSEKANESEGKGKNKAIAKKEVPPEPPKESSPKQEKKSNGEGEVNNPGTSSVKKDSKVDDFNLDTYLQFDMLAPLLNEIDAERTSVREETKSTQSKFSKFFNKPQDGGAQALQEDLQQQQLHQHQLLQQQHQLKLEMENQNLLRVIQPNPPVQLNTQQMLANLAGLQQVHHAEHHGTWALGNSAGSAQEMDAAAAFISAFCKDQPNRAFGSKLKDLAETLKIPSVDELEAHVLANRGQTGRTSSHPGEEDRMAKHMDSRKQAQEHAQYLKQSQQRPQQLLYPPQYRDGLPVLPPDLQYSIANATPTPEIISRTDYNTLMSGVKRGVMTPQHLVNLLMNNVVHPDRRESILCVLNVIFTSHRAGSPIVGRDSPANHAMIHHQNGVPSRGELVAHTASIMQNALIKKKLEEQLENFKKRQDVSETLVPPRNPSPNMSQCPSSLAFTPTAVLRKMTASGGQIGGETSPTPGLSPVRASTPALNDLRPEGLSSLCYGSYGSQGQLSPASLQGSVPNMAQFPPPMHMMQAANFRPPMRYSPQAFIGQFAQQRPAPLGPPNDGQWWTPEAMGRVVRGNLTVVPPPVQNIPQQPRSPLLPNTPVQMMTVEELERNQQQSSDTPQRSRRARRLERCLAFRKKMENR